MRQRVESWYYVQNHNILGDIFFMYQIYDNIDKLRIILSNLAVKNVFFKYDVLNIFFFYCNCKMFYYPKTCIIFFFDHDSLNIKVNILNFVYNKIRCVNTQIIGR